jgi:hypothetical protein
MGWYLRKAVKFGPLRVNFSKSGIGYSLGIKGARIGTGPRGPYIAGGRYGIYYRQSLNTPTHPALASHAAIPQPIVPAYPSAHCSHCGAAILDGNHFCIQCGTAVPTPIETHDYQLAAEKILRAPDSVDIAASRKQVRLSLLLLPVRRPQTSTAALT